MNLLLDTHTLLWMFAAPDRLGEQAAEAVVDAQNALCVSAGSLWEIAIKIDIGKLDLGRDWSRRLDRRMTQSSVTVLPVGLNHCERVSKLPHHHRDPFDRLIVAQSLVEKLPVVSRDDHFDSYGVRRLW